MLNIVRILKGSFLLGILSLLFLNISFAKDRFIVAIDVGHSKTRYGATSSRGVAEYKFNRAIAEVLHKKIITNKYLNGFIINPDGNKIALKDRTKIAEEKKADIFISLHHDSVQQKYLDKWDFKQKINHYSDRFSGYSIFISNKNGQAKESYKFAIFLGEQLDNSGFIPTLHHAEKIKGENRQLLDKKIGVYEFNDLVVLKTASMPAALLECGVIVNRKEELLVNSQGFKNEVTNEIINAILKYREWIKDTQNIGKNIHFKNDTILKSKK